MKKLNEILNESGVTKVKLSKYLGVSRQMVYNYLEMDSINEWPLEKKIKLCYKIIKNYFSSKTIFMILYFTKFSIANLVLS